MQSRRTFFSQLAVLIGFTLVLCLPSHAQDDAAKRGRKYKAPPPTSHIEVVVRKKFNGKPIMNAAVVFNSSMDGKDEGNLEVKTDPDGKATIDVIPTGSTVRVQVIATGFATFAEEYVVDGPTKAIDVAMLRPQEQLSSYQDNQGKAASRKPGVQEPIRPTTPATTSTTPAPAATPQTPPPDATPKQ
jgi:hypothetical protein